MAKKQGETKGTFQDALDKLNKQYGVGTILTLDSKPHGGYNVISSGSVSLDYVTLGIGGYAKGKLYELMGWEGCLAEDTYIKFINVRPDGIVQDCKGGTIKNLYERFHIRTEKTQNTTFNIISINEEDKVFRNEIADVVSSGVKECFELITKKGFKIKATKDHKFYTGDNYISLEDLSVGDEVYVHTNTPYINEEVKERKKYKETTLKYYYKGKQREINGSLYYREKVHRLIYEAYMNNLTYEEYIGMLNTFSPLQMLPQNIWTIPDGYEVHHIDENTQNNDIDNLQLILPSDHSKLHALDRHNNLRFIVMPDEIISITSVGEMETYDIKCYFPYNNFIAEGIVVHNSGKSTLCGHAVANCQKDGGTALYIDGEHALDKTYFKALGVDTEKMLISQPSCIWEEEYFLTSRGNKKMKEIDKSTSTVSISNNNLSSSSVSDIIKSNKNGIILRTSKFEIIASEDHKIKTFDGFKKLGEIDKNNDVVETFYKCTLSNQENITELSKNQSFILGMFIGDGNYNRSTVRLYGIDEELINYTINIIKEEFPDTTFKRESKKSISFIKNGERNTWKKTSLKLFLNKYLGEVSKQDKYIPEEIYYSGKENISYFLSGLFMSDGCVESKKNSISFSSYIKNVILDVSYLLSYFAIPNSIYTKKKEDGVCYEIVINSKEGIENFRNNIPLLSYKKDKLYKIDINRKDSFIRFPKELWRTIFDEIRIKYGTITKFSNLFFNNNIKKHLFNTKRGISHEYLIKINSLLKSKELQKLIDSDVAYVNIIDIIDTETIYPMIDIIVPFHHNFISNGIVVHNCGEEGFNIAMEMINTGEIDLVIIDSDSSLIPKKQLDGDVGDSTIGKKALLNSNAYPKLKTALARNNVCVIVVSQYREKIGVMFGNPTTTQGGHALKFYSDCRLEISRSLAKDGDETYGNITKVKASKNKMSPPYRKCEFDIVYGKGIDRIGEMMQLINDLEMGKKWGKTLTIDDVKHDVDEFRQLLIDNPEFYDEWRDKIKNKLNEIHAEE